MNPQEFEKWSNDESEKHCSVIVDGPVKWEQKNPVKKNSFKAGADAAYNLLSKEISEKDEEIKRLKGLIKSELKERWVIVEIDELVHSGYAHNYSEIKANENFEQFKIENNL